MSIPTLVITGDHDFFPFAAEAHRAGHSERPACHTQRLRTFSLPGMSRAFAAADRHSCTGAERERFSVVSPPSWADLKKIFLS
jgi:hypothetical protein